MATRVELEHYTNTLLDIGRFRDYGPNGLQVEGRAEVCLIISGVTASQALIDAAIAERADAVLVHHGLFWRGHDGRVVGWMKRRLQALLAHDINLLAYHLPLDAHPELGNNAQLGRVLGWMADERFGEQDLGCIGTLPQAMSLPALQRHIEQPLGRAATAIEGDGRLISRVAWCSGGAQGHFEAAIAAGADAFVTGELSEPQTHLARETGVAFLACGHHATERYGAQALGAHLAQRFGIEHRFIEIDNPA